MSNMSYKTLFRKLVPGSYFLLFLCSPVLSTDLAMIKLDAAKKSSCSTNSPCSINYKGHNGTYIVKVTSVTVTDGIININHYKYRRFVYDANGKFLYEINK